MKDKVNYITLPLVLAKSDAAVHFIRASSSVDAGVTTSTQPDLFSFLSIDFGEVAVLEGELRLPSFLYERLTGAAGELVGEIFTFETVFTFEMYGFRAFDLDARHILFLDSSITLSTAPLDAFIFK